jgi:hypothetical protein
MNNHDAPGEGTSCDEQGNATKPFILEDYHHVCQVDTGDRIATATPSAVAHEVDEGSFLPSVTSSYSEQLHSYKLFPPTNALFIRT